MMSHRLNRRVFAVVFAGLLLATSATRGQEKKDEKVEIPKKVMDALKAKFPKAAIDKVTKEKEGDKDVYDIEFKQGKQKFEADIFADGTIHNWEKEVAEKDLPKAVSDAAYKKYPKSTFKEIMQITDVKDGKDTPGGFEIVLETADKKSVEITVSPEGKILEDSTDPKKEEKK